MTKLLSLRNVRASVLAGGCLLVLGGTLPAGARVAGTASGGQAANVAVVYGYSSYTFAQGMRGETAPDDIVSIGGDVFVGWQNGVGTMGEPSTTTIIPGSNPPKLGQPNSTIIEYKLAGGTSLRKPIASWSIKGKCDGLSADPASNRLLASVNEDGNSSLYVIPVGGGSVQHYAYSPDPSTIGGGGTDAITVANGVYYTSGSNPSAGNAPAVYTITLGNGTATLKPVFSDNATASSSSGPVTLALTDPDSNAFVPTASAHYAGDLVLNSQADSQMIFVKNPGSAAQTLTQLSIGASIDDITWATSSKGLLLLTDNTDNRVVAIKYHFSPGTAYVSTANDSGVGQLVGTISLTTGLITPVAIGFANPHGLIFVATP
jgi:hypothetical protein